MTILKAAFTSAALAAGGLFVMTPGDADAQIRVQIGGHHGHGYGGYRYGDDGYGRGGYGHGGAYRGSAGYGFDNSGYGFSEPGLRSGGYRYGSRRYDGYSGQRYGGSRRGWHDTSHYDYHPTTVVPHGNHYDVVPGHYYYHRSGHRH